MKPCSSGQPQQTWAYNNNLTLVAGVVGDHGSAAWACAWTPARPRRRTWSSRCRPCGTTTICPSSSGASTTRPTSRARRTARRSTAYCFNVQNPNVSGSQIILSTNCNGGYDNIQTFSPDGGGRRRCGRCDRRASWSTSTSSAAAWTSPTRTSTSSFLIDWPCKQAPDPTNVAWNQRWVLPTAQREHDHRRHRRRPDHDQLPSNGTLYCLQSPLSAAAGQYVVVTQCPATGTPTNMKWTVYGDDQHLLDELPDQDATSTTSPLLPAADRPERDPAGPVHQRQQHLEADRAAVQRLDPAEVERAGEPAVADAAGKTSARIDVAPGSLACGVDALPSPRLGAPRPRSVRTARAARFCAGHLRERSLRQSGRSIRRCHVGVVPSEAGAERGGVWGGNRQPMHDR